MSGEICSVDSNNVSQILGKLHDMVNCIICRDKYKHPKILGCYHYFCLECLQSIINESRGFSAPCPVCRKSFTATEGRADTLAPCPFVEDLVKLVGNEEINPEETRFETNCQVCEDTSSTAKHLCMYCTMYMCDKCTTLHDKFRMDNHNIIPIDDIRGTPIMSIMAHRGDARFCTQQEHTGNVLDKFCTSCKNVICQKCCETSHKYHLVENLSNATTNANEFMRKVSTSLDRDIKRLSEQKQNLNAMKTTFNNSVSDISRKVTESSEECIKLIKVKKVKTLKHLEAISNQKTKHLQNIHEDIDIQMKTRESLLQFTDSVKTFGNNMQRTEKRSIIEERFDAFQREQAPEIPSENCELRLKESIKLQDFLVEDVFEITDAEMVCGTRSCNQNQNTPGSETTTQARNSSPLLTKPWGDISSPSCLNEETHQTFLKERVKSWNSDDSVFDNLTLSESPLELQDQYEEPIKKSNEYKKIENSKNTFFSLFFVTARIYIFYIYIMFELQFGLHCNFAINKKKIKF